jgi:hypothetical protein
MPAGAHCHTRTVAGQDSTIDVIDVRVHEVYGSAARAR